MVRANRRLQAAPEFVSTLHSVCRRLEKHIAFCDAEIDALMHDSALFGLVKARQLQILMRTLQGLQKDWVKHMGMLHPDVPIVSPSERTVSSKELDTFSNEELRFMMAYYLQNEADRDEDAYQQFLDDILDSRKNETAADLGHAASFENRELAENAGRVPPPDESQFIHSDMVQADENGCKSQTVLDSQEEPENSKPASKAGKRLRVKDKYSYSFFRRPPPKPDS